MPMQIVPVVTWTEARILPEIVAASATGDVSRLTMPSTLVASLSSGSDHDRIEIALPFQARSPKGFLYDPEVMPSEVTLALGALAARQSPVGEPDHLAASLRAAARQGSIAGLPLHLDGASLPLHVCEAGIARVPDKAQPSAWLPPLGDYLHDVATSGLLDRYPALRELREPGHRFSSVELLYLPVVAPVPDADASSHARLALRRKLRLFAAAIYPMHAAQIAPVLMPGDPIFQEPRC